MNSHSTQSRNGPTDLSSHQIDERLDPEILRKLSRVHPWRAVLHIVMEWTFIVAAICFCQAFWHAAAYVICVIWIAARQHALGILIHDGAHYRLVRSKFWNDVICELLLAFPLFITTRGYRRTHLAHHRHPNTDEDPDWVTKDTPDWEFPKTHWQMFLMLAKLAIGLNALKMLRLVIAGGGATKSTGSQTADPVFITGRLSFYVAGIVAITFFELWPILLLYWLIPMFSWLQVILRIRSIAEHFGIEHDHPYTESRTTYPSLFDRLFLVSKNIWYHLDHHLYPSVPFYNLPRLHQALLELPMFRQKAHITRGYLGVLLECTNDPQRSVST